MAEEPTPQDQELQEAQERISRRIGGFALGLIGVMTVAMAVAYVAVPGHHMARPVAAVPAAQTVTVAMHDPGCHWFQVGTSYEKSVRVTGPVNLQNSDEAALMVAGSGNVKKEPVGQRLSLTPGSYRITMVGQAADDNTLHLRVD